MRIYNYLESTEGYDFCGIPTVKPLSMNLFLKILGLV